MPSPTETELRVHPSPVPTRTVLGLFGSSASAPIDCTDCLSNTGLNVVPPSSDFHTPPDAAPTNSVVRPSSSWRAAIAAIRPLIVAEPILRAPRPDTVAESNLIAGAEAGALSAPKATASGSAQQIAPVMRLRSMIFPLVLFAAGRKREPRVFKRNVCFRLVDREGVLLRAADAAAGHGKRHVNSVDLFVVAVVGLLALLDAANRALLERADHQECIGVEPDVLHVAVFQHDLELVRVR